MEKTFYITTPIYYPNDIPHIGHAYTTIACDILSRWYGLFGYETYFLTGTDEHGKKIEEAAHKHNLEPKEFVDTLIPKFKEAWGKLDIKYDRFIRTTDEDHIKVVKDILQKIYDKGDLYLGKYQGYYCTACESYYLEKDLINNKCPIHKTEIEQLEEESYFFRLSKYKDQLLKLYKNKFVLPESRANEIIARVSERLDDVSISRKNLKWGIELPFDKSHVLYVWIDALINYLTGAGYLFDQEKFNKIWPADIHLMAKDILWFHAAIWPAILLSVDLPLPKHVFSHGYWTMNQEKIGKSSGNFIAIDELIGYAGVDALRYYLFSEIPFGQDGDFSKDALIARYNNELADNLGNLISRVSTLIEKYGLEKTDNTLVKKLDFNGVKSAMEELQLNRVLKMIFNFIDECNLYITNTKPWETQDKKVLYELADSIKAIGILLSPFMPKTSEKISQVFNFDIKIENQDKPIEITKIRKADPLFNKVG